MKKQPTVYGSNLVHGGCSSFCGSGALPVRGNRDHILLLKLLDLLSQLLI